MGWNDTFAEKVATYADHDYRVYRIGVGVLMVLAGLHQFLSPGIWAGYMAPWAASVLELIGVAPTVFMQVNAVVEVVFGLFILADRYTTIASGVVALSLLGIVVNLATAGTGFTDIIIRDIGLFFMATGLTLQAAKRHGGGS